MGSQTRADLYGLDSLPAETSTNNGGYVYVLVFNEGTVKVGSTGNPRGRIGIHVSRAAGFGIRLDRYWLSALHSQHTKSETAVLEIARAMAGEVRLNEYFASIDADKLVRRAARITNEAKSRAKLRVVQEMPFLKGPFLTLREAADRLGVVSERWLADACRAKRISAVKRHGRWVLTPSLLDAFIEQHRVPASLLIRPDRSPT